MRTPKSAAQEKWLPVPGYEGYYEASDHGRIRSVARLIDQLGGGKRMYRGRVLRPAPAGSGYHSVCLSVDGEVRRRYVHRLVMLAFAGPCPPGMEVCHGDGTRINNSLSNLRYDTRSGNHADKWRHGTMRRKRVVVTTTPHSADLPSPQEDDQ